MNDVRGRILIVPVGHFAERAKARPLTSDQTYKINPNHTYLITQHHDPDNDYIDKFRTVVEEVYSAFTVFGETTVLGTENYFNIFELMSVFRFICELHSNDTIFINVGCGSKLTAMAGYMISGWYDNVQCFYPRVTITRPEIPGTPAMSDKINDIQIIQSFPVKKMRSDFVPVLNYLKSEPKSKKEILSFLQEEDHISIYFETDKGEKKERSPQSLYNILKRNYIDPMDEEELILENEDGEIELTKQGKNMQIIFGEEIFHYEMV